MQTNKLFKKVMQPQLSKILRKARSPCITQNGEVKLVVLVVKSYEEQEETLALLKILAMGNQDIEQGKFRDVEGVFNENIHPKGKNCWIARTLTHMKMVFICSKVFCAAASHSVFVRLLNIIETDTLIRSRITKMI